MTPFLALAFAATTPAPAPVTVDSLLREMTDLRTLAHRPENRYRYRQSTSYDRASDGWKDPFANGDFGQFIRDEMVEGRKEQVMAEVKGPGALVKVWSANPIGTIRFYFDGEAKPRLTADLKEILSGRHPLFPDPYAYVAAQGCNLYFPMPFANGLKVTWDGGGKVPGSGLYYIVGFREYDPGARVESFVPDAVTKARAGMARASAALLAPAKASGGLKGGTISAGGTLSLDYRARGGGEIRDFTAVVDAPDDTGKAWADPSRTHNLLRKLRLRMSFDGETTVDVPLGDFFGSAPGVTPFASLPIQVQKDGTMVARWSMPYRRGARIWVVNDNAQPVRLRIGATNETRAFTPGTYLFHARFNSQTRSTRPMYDYTYVDVKGEGRYVGSGLHVANPVPEWWGEGDEKVYVDGETFPSLFGTGTEDYFGYAWCDPAPFSRPYHAQPPTPNMGNFGQTYNSRYHIIDDIPFQKGIRFDMEAWHWANTNATYATTAFWYALPNTTLPKAPTADELTVHETPFPKPIAGAIEGENLSWSVTGGRFEAQSGFFQLSGLRQFWWREPNVGDVATAKVSVPSAGRYEVIANLGHARDYGRFKVMVAGKEGREVDLYLDGLEWRRESLGTFDLPAGETTIQFQVLEGNAKMNPRFNLLGVDYFLLEKR